MRAGSTAQAKIVSSFIVSNETFILPHKIDGSDYVYTLESICLDAGFFPNVVHHTAGLEVTIEPKRSLSGQKLAINFIERNKITQKTQSAICGVIIGNESIYHPAIG